MLANDDPNVVGFVGLPSTFTSPLVNIFQRQSFTSTIDLNATVFRIWLSDYDVQHPYSGIVTVFVFDNSTNSVVAAANADVDVHTDEAQQVEFVFDPVFELTAGDYYFELYETGDAMWLRLEMEPFESVTSDMLSNVVVYPAEILGIAGRSSVAIFEFEGALSGETYSVTYSANWPAGVAGSGSVPVDGNLYSLGATVTVQTNSGNLLSLDGDLVPVGWDFNPLAVVPEFLFTYSNDKYVVTDGQTLDAIASMFSTTSAFLLELNDLSSSDLVTGQVLQVPVWSVEPPTFYMPDSNMVLYAVWGVQTVEPPSPPSGPDVDSLNDVMIFVLFGILVLVAWVLAVIRGTIGLYALSSGLWFAYGFAINIFGLSIGGGFVTGFTYICFALGVIMSLLMFFELAKSVSNRGSGEESVF